MTIAKLNKEEKLELIKKTWDVGIVVDLLADEDAEVRFAAAASYAMVPSINFLVTLKPHILHILLRQPKEKCRYINRATKVLDEVAGGYYV